MKFYDFEVFARDWLVVILDMENQEEHVIVNDPDYLAEIYHRGKDDVWCGFNSREYDQYIMKGILCGFDPKEINDFIILRGHRGWQFSELFRNIQFYNYDVMQNIDRGLKVFEGFMGSDIRETSVPFDIDRKLMPEEIAETVKYCRHDVEQTIEVFIRRKADFDAQMGLIKMFSLPLSYISKTKAQISARILEASRRTYDDEFDIDFPDTMRIEKYTHVLDWYRDPAHMRYRVDPDNPKSKKMQLDTVIAGVPHVFGWGGVHGALTKYQGEGYFINVDVESLYPSLMIEYGLLSRSCNPEKFRDIRDTRLKLKHEKNPMQAPLKIVINGTYGASKDKNNALYDPRQANRVCVYGQILLLDLIERFEEIGAIIIQSNTDGVLVKMPEGFPGGPDGFFSCVDDVAYEWEKRTRLKLEFDEYERVYQKDVNNYVIVAPDGHYKSKGAYVKSLNDLDYDLAVVNRALIEYMVHGVPVVKTISSCDVLRDFQQVKKISSKFDYLWHNGEILSEKTARIYASTDERNTELKMKHKNKSTLDRVSNSPEHAAIWNRSVEGVKCPRDLDRSWYISLAEKRLEGFGVL